MSKPKTPNRVRSSELVSLLVEDMESEAKQFGECAKIHDARGNKSAADVAWRAQEIINRFVGTVKAG